eukprot:6388837-Pyramimonas_sp.AAC.1
MEIRASYDGASMRGEGCFDDSMAVALICMLNSRAFRNLEASWGSTWDYRGPLLGPPGALPLGSPEILLGPSWGICVLCLGVLGLFGGAWGPSWGSVGMPEGPLGPSW